MGADAFPERPDAWSDQDGDLFADQPNLDITDDCPTRYGTSRSVLFGCSDMDFDWIPDVLDTDIDGDGISNELEIASSGALFQYDPMDANSYPIDSDYDTIPDAVDEDDDNDFWPDTVELDRGSDPLDPEQTPFNRYFGVTTGFFYYGGFTTDDKYDAEASITKESSSSESQPPTAAEEAASLLQLLSSLGAPAGEVANEVWVVGDGKVAKAESFESYRKKQLAKVRAG